MYYVMPWELFCQWTHAMHKLPIKCAKMLGKRVEIYNETFCQIIQIKHLCDFQSRSINDCSIILIKSLNEIE